MPYIGNDIQFGELTSQTFTGDGSTTAFTLGYTVANPTSLIVTIANVIQEPTTAYTVAGTTLTCTSAPADGDTIHVRFLGRVVDVANAAILQDSDQDTKIQVEESADEDTIRFDIAGAEDFTMTANDFTALSGSTISTNTIAETTSGSGVTIDGLLIKDGAVNNVAGKNLIRNGAMTVAQRGTQAGMGGANAYTAQDRWELRYAGSPNSRMTTSLATLSLADSVLAGGQRTALEIDCTTAETAVAAGEFHIIVQKIEGQNLQHLQFGNAAAKTLSAQFGIRSPKSGTHCVAFYSPDGNRGYIAEFTVASADTFEVIKINGIPGDTAGTINNDTGEGMRIAFPLICGSTFQGSAGAWFTGEKYATSNQQNLLDNTANNIYITGVQLEVGSVATDFEHEDIGTTLAKCQRYFFRAASGDQGPLPNTTQTSTTGSTAFFALPTTMRADPTLAYSDLSHFGIAPAVTQVSPTALSITYVMESAAWVSVVWSAGSGAAGEAPRFYTINASATLDFSAEL